MDVGSTTVTLATTPRTSAAVAGMPPSPSSWMSNVAPGPRICLRARRRVVDRDAGTRVEHARRCQRVVLAAGAHAGRVDHGDRRGADDSGRRDHGERAGQQPRDVTRRLHGVGDPTSRARSSARSRARDAGAASPEGAVEAQRRPVPTISRQRQVARRLSPSAARARRRRPRPPRRSASRGSRP